VPRTAEKPKLSEEEAAALKFFANGRTHEARMVQRARIVLMAASGASDVAIASKLGVTVATVGKWRGRYIKERLDGIKDRPRSGKPPKYDPDKTRNAILSKLGEPPPKGQQSWDGKALSKALDISDDKVYRVLRATRICLKKRRSWCVSKDPDFATKAADVVGLYMDPPEGAVVLSLDEKPSIQAIERSKGYVMTSSGEIVSGDGHTYLRHGICNLFAVLNVKTGNVATLFAEKKRRVEFLKFMDIIVQKYPVDKEIHVILDNYCIHKNCDQWLADHPNVHFHFTPTSASWLNMVEIWFGMMSRKTLRGGSFKNVKELQQAINDYCEVYNLDAKPFVWRKREVKGSQLRNTVMNLCN
jgi:transposase